MNPELGKTQHRKALQNIKLLALDIDGILTDGRIFWIKDQNWTRFFNVQDGYGMAQLKRAGVDVALISSGQGPDLDARVERLKIEHAYLGSENKKWAFDQILKNTGFEANEIAYMGDELFDVPVLEQAGFSATVPHAVDEVKEVVNYITQREGGYGAVREVIEGIRKAQGLKFPISKQAQG